MPTENISFPFDLALPPVLPLKAGQLAVSYERGNLRTVRLGETEILRMIYIAVRDHYWTTADYVISNEHVKSGKDNFTISYLATWSYDQLNVFEAEVAIEGKADSTIRFSMKGKALQDFRRNRIGICVHHPIRECAGKQASVTIPDGSSYQSVFPELIAPHQPFLDIYRMEWNPVENTSANLTFEGDVFESEDQRNWGDACYKTYSTPLSIPIPVAVKKGDTVTQSVLLQVAGKGAAQASKPDSATSIESISFPTIGLQRSSRQVSLSAGEIELLRNAFFGYYRCELNLDGKNWAGDLERFTTEARQLKVVIDLVVFMKDGNTTEIEALVTALQPYGRQLNSLLVLKQGEKVTPAPLLQFAYPLMKKALPTLKVGYGTDAYFTELNRSRPDVSTPFDFVSFSINPQVHASDTRSIMENVEALPWVIKTARSFARGKEVFVSPFTLKKRNNPDAAGGEVTSIPDKLPEGVDARQSSGFLAAFTLLAIAGLGEADRLQLYETAGWKGVMQGEAPPERPALFPVSQNELFPVYELLKKLKEFNPVQIYRPASLSWGEAVVLVNKAGDKLKLVF